MSGEILFDVMNCDGFEKPAMKLLLIALADRADEAGICWPSRDDLRLRTGLSLSSITRTARALEAAQFIQRKQRRDTSTLYRLNVAKIAQSAAKCKAERRLRRAGESWPQFPEEAAQAVENNGEGQSEPTSGQIEPTSGQTEPTSGHAASLTSQEPLKKPRRRRAARPSERPSATSAQAAHRAVVARSVLGPLADVPTRVVGTRREFQGPDGHWYEKPRDAEEAKRFQAWCFNGTAAPDRRAV